MESDNFHRGEVMNNQRRNVLKSGSGAALLSVLAAAGIIKPGMALAEWNKSAFDAKSMADTLKALGAATPVDSKDVQVTGPDIAENGAVVPVGVSSTLPNISMVAVLIEKNPNALAASFTLPEGTQANVQTRVKMGQTSNVYARSVVRHFAKKPSPGPDSPTSPRGRGDRTRPPGLDAADNRFAPSPVRVSSVFDPWLNL
jgi:sulfur-oxidizing protein SoxY